LLNPATPNDGDLWHADDTLKFYDATAGTIDLGAGADTTADETVSGAWTFTDVITLDPAGTQTAMLKILRHGATGDSKIEFMNDLDTVTEGVVGWDESDDAIVVRATTGNDVRIESGTTSADNVYLVPGSTAAVIIQDAKLTGPITRRQINWTYP
jgi:hypothetical protein